MARVSTVVPHNTPFFRPVSIDSHQEVWYLKLNDPEARRALWLRFTLLVRADGTKRLAEVWAIAFERTATEVKKVAVKRTRRAEEFVLLPPEEKGFRIGECIFAARETEGAVGLPGGNTIRWRLRFAPARPAAFDFVPPVLKRLRMVRNIAWTVHEDLRFNGLCEVNGTPWEFTDAPGMQGHLAGARNGYSWAWGHCNHFHDQEGKPVRAIWDGLSGRGRKGQHGSTMQMSGMYIHYKGTDYAINNLWPALRMPSRFGLTGWRFEARLRERRFVGRVDAAPDEFAGVTYEDTDGSQLYCYNSKISSMALEVYHNNTLEDVLTARGTVAYEVVTREKRENVPLLL
ncbi:MAG: hypothetical protein ACLFTT_11665 [Candidatus Hydrogenedentota bacterium]